LQVLGLALVGLLSACAEGVTGDDIGQYAMFDASVETQPEAAVAEPEAGVILAPYDAGPVVPNIPPNSTVRDSGTARDAGSTDTPARLDASVTPLDSSTGGSTDTGAPKPVDSGTTPPKTDAATSGGATCAAAPAYSTATNCAKCTCTKCASQVTACFASSDSAKNTQCASVQACAETNHCAGEDCYCGSSLLCLDPAGMCKSVIETAANATSPLDVQSAGNDANNPVGRAKAIGECEKTSCKSECGL
jgi:hypothetical protein